MNNDQQIKELAGQIERLKNELETLSAAFYKNNFSNTQVFNKNSIFTTKLKVPTYTTLPNCEVGEVGQVGGTLYICSATNTWTIVGTQS